MAKIFEAFDQTQAVTQDNYASYMSSTSVYAQRVAKQVSLEKQAEQIRAKARAEGRTTDEELTAGERRRLGYIEEEIIKWKQLADAIRKAGTESAEFQAAAAKIDARAAMQREADKTDAKIRAQEQVERDKEKTPE